MGHPAPFPVELPRRLIDLYTYRDDMVLDPFLGSGTTLVAAQRAGRRGVGYDLDPTYVTLAKQRVEEERRRLEEVQPEAWRRRDLTGDSATQGGLFETMDGPTGEGQRAMDHVLTRATASGKKVADIGTWTWPGRSPMRVLVCAGPTCSGGPSAGPTFWPPATPGTSSGTGPDS